MKKSIKYRRKIKIGNNVTRIINLPCICGCKKDNNSLVYFLFAWDEYGDMIEAHPGDWLCEDYDGRWIVVKQ